MRIFLFAAGLNGLVSFQLNSPAIDGFQPRTLDSGASSKMDNLPSLIHARAKMATALENDRFNYALFGNSRSLMIGDELLGLPAGQYFNFSIAGQSFRNSVMPLEWLSENDRLPNTAIISIDHLGLELFGNGAVPTLYLRLRSLIRDLESIYDLNGPWRSNVRAPKRFVWSFCRI
ncbi:MAG: hypothetical protein ACPGQV_12025 [Alphaproteobacteria bacterium]